MTGFLSKYLSFTQLSMKQTLMYKTALFGRVFLVTLLVSIFYKLWQVVFQSYDDLPFTFIDAVWYIATTESILNGYFKTSPQIDQDIKNGDIVYSLNRPASYFLMKQFDALGIMAVRMPLCLGVGWSMAFLLTQSLPSGIHLLPIVFLCSFLAANLHSLWTSICGLTAFWTQDSAPTYLVYSKLTFLFGGLLFPLDIYPEWIQQVALWTPFSVIFYGPASMLFNPDLMHVSTIFIRLIFWTVVTIGLNMVVFNLCQKRLSVNGG